MPELKFIVMCGLPYSGKSTLAEEIAAVENAVILSSDKVREELYGNENIQGDPQEVFGVIHKRIRETLTKEKSVILDATNVRRKNRKHALDYVRRLKVKKVCYVIPESLTTIKKRKEENKRGREVPLEVILKMRRRWDTPYYFEGWDEIHLVGCNKLRMTGELFVEREMYYDQMNPHHTLTLGRHCYKAYEYLINSGVINNNLLQAALLHDCGKPAVQKIDENGIAHYYDHQNVGAYDALTYQYPDRCDPLFISILINLHMFPLNWKNSPQETERLKRKYKRIWGKELFDSVMLLHDADTFAL